MARKVRNGLRGLLQAYGPTSVKRWLWDTEFARGRWDCLDRTPDDCVYPYLEKYANRGSILDLGCGSGSTGNELAASVYRHYTGVDISEVAIDKARRRSEENDREGKNRYVESDIVSYVPTRRFDLILFRDSIYYVPPARIKAMLDRYARHLEDGGVFIVRLASGSHVYPRIVDTIERGFEVLERRVFDDPNAIVMVFRPYAAA